MPETPNHNYNVPEQGTSDWHTPLNENFSQYDTDIEIRDQDANKSDYQPKDGAKFLATDTGQVYLGDGTSWNKIPSTGEELSTKATVYRPRGPVTTGDIADGEVMLYNSDGTDSHSAGDLVYAINRNGSINTQVIVPDSNSSGLAVPFTEEFTDGLNEWTVGRRYRTGEEREPDNPPAGEGGYSESYDGSVRLHVNGGPSTIGVGRTLTGLPAGTTVSVTYHVEASSSQPGKVGIPVFSPDGDDMVDTWVAQNSGDVQPGENTITGTTEKRYPAESQLRVTADVWPGEFTAYITRIQATQS